VFVADDFEPWHRFVALALECDPEYEVVGGASDAANTIQQCQVLHPNVILIDTALSGCDPFLLTRQIRTMLPQTQVILFSHTVSLRSIEAALKAGAHGFLAKSDAHDLLIAFDTVTSGEYYLSRTTQDVPHPTGIRESCGIHVVSATETASSIIAAPTVFSAPILLPRLRQLIFQEVWWYISLFLICCIILSILAARG